VSGSSEVVLNQEFEVNRKYKDVPPRSFSLTKVTYTFSQVSQLTVLNMLQGLSIFCLLATLGYASPIVYTRATNDTDPFIFTNYNGLNFTQMNATLPNVTIFATGMTPFFLQSVLADTF
jgi:hypothetical protein